MIRARWGPLLLCGLLAGCDYLAIGSSRSDAPATPAAVFPGVTQVQDRQYAIEGRTIHYVEMAGGPARIVFIHGTPGDWSGWQDYLRDPRLLARATLIAVDRPGFGTSDPGHVVPALADQARLLQPLLASADGNGTLLVGHSLGGPIAGEMALDFPDQVRGALLVAPSIDPEYEHPAWYNDLLAWLPVKWAFRDEWVFSNEEMMPLHRELVKQSTRWAALRVPVTVLQGDKDDLVDPRTADFADRVLPKPQTQVLRAVGETHFVIWQNPDRVVDAILALLDRSAAPPAAAAP